MLSERMYQTQLNNITLLVFVLLTAQKYSSIFPLTSKQELKLTQIINNITQSTFFIGITPNGSIYFLSRCWGDHVSDTNPVSNTTFYKLLLPGDVVLANHGFTMGEDI